MKNMFDPAIGRNPNIARVNILDADFEGARPIFIDLHGLRQSVPKWSSALRFTMMVAGRAANDISLIEMISGCNFEVGHRRGGIFVDELNATVTRVPLGSPGLAIQRTIASLHLPCKFRIEQTLRGKTSEIVIENIPQPHLIPTFGKPLPFTPGIAPGLRAQRAVKAIDTATADRLICAREGEIQTGSIVCISIKNVVENGIFRIIDGEGQPSQGLLGKNSAVVKAILGHKAGDESSYNVGKSLRKIEIINVDNLRLCEKLQSELPEFSPELPEPSM